MRVRRAVVVIFSVLSSACSSRASTPKLHGAPRPYLFVRQIGVGAIDKPSTGLVAAVWPDGTVARSDGLNQVGRRYVRGSITGEELNKLVCVFESTGLWDQYDGTITVIAHAASRELVVRNGGEMRMWTQHPWDALPVPEIQRVIALLMELPLLNETPLKWDDVYPHGWHDDKTPSDDPFATVVLRCQS